MFDKLNKRTREALEAIETGTVRWQASSSWIRFTIPTGEVSEHGYPYFESIDLGFLSERLYEREGWRDSDEGIVALTPAGRAELRDLQS